MLYSEQIPDNLGIIFRKEYEDLRDSTVKDFEKYTGLKVDSHREVRLPNNSQILFRHIEELNNIQNVNLGWFAIEQGDELETDNEFFMLFGRLRRQVMPSGYFRDLGLPERSGFVICNAGEHWIKNLWKQSKLEDSELFEATTWDNADVLPKDFLDGLRILEKNKNEIYRQYVMNDWSVSPDQLILIPTSLLESLKELDLLKPKTKKIISCDPAIGGDECVVQVFDTGNIIEQKILHDRDTMKVAGELMLTGATHKITDYIIDSIGVGKGIVDRLNELGMSVQAFNSAEKSLDERFYNRRVEAYWYVMEQMRDKKIEYPQDTELRKQLSSVRYKVISSNGRVQLEAKDKIKERLGRSPDRADAYCMGVWGLQFVNEWQPRDKWYRPQRYEYAFNPNTV